VDRPELIAYHGTGATVPIVPAPRWREWMNATNERSANRCLPLLVANESGWALMNPLTFTATWSGADHPDAVSIEWAEPVPDRHPVESHFGYGVITWTVPYLFRTPPGWNLLARGPANWPRDGISALEGVVETDWAVATFTMNWKLTRPGLPVTFPAGEPFCVIVPQRRGELETFEVTRRPLKSDERLLEQVRAWQQGRDSMQVQKFLAEYSKDFEDAWDAWEQSYFRGRYPDGRQAPEHQTKLRLAQAVDHAPGG
jgi:hypothetical protein